MLRHYLLGVSVGTALITRSAWASEAKPPFRDPDLPVETRVGDLVSRLSTEEKIGQLMMASPAIPRLGIPAYDWWNEALHGVARNGVATVFPQAIALAAAWDPELHGRIADAISTEARAKNNELLTRSGGASGRYEGLTIWSPNINIFRDPRWGRGQETYGEDPFLTAELAVAFVRGLQGSDPRYLKTVATLKHFAVHSGPEESRHRFDAVVSDRDLHETYLPAFEAGVREGGACSLMSAYNAVDGVPAPANAWLLTDILRRDWGFKGAVVGDVDTVADIWRESGHHFAGDPAAASALAIKAGNDLCSGETYKSLGEALERHLLEVADLDRALGRLMRLRFELGQFDPRERVPYASIPLSENDAPGHDQLALEASRQSLVLLKNDGALPLDPRKIRSIAVIGPTADALPALLGNYQGTPSRPSTILAGLQAKLGPMGIRVQYAPGCPLADGFREACQPFPPGVLCADETGTVPGLAAEMYDNPGLSGAPAIRRTDAQVDYRWNEFEPLPGLATKETSASWSGWMAAPASGRYAISVQVTGGARLLIDGEAVIDSWSVSEHRLLTTEISLRQGHPARIQLYYTQGGGTAEIALGWRMLDGANELESAKRTASQADCTVLVLGLTPQLEGEEMRVEVPGFRGGDRTSVLLPSSQVRLLKEIRSVGRPLIVVLTTGSALAFDPSQADAILVAWYYGQRGADAVAEALVGETNPAGRLPITFYASDSDLPAFESYSMEGRTYRFFKGVPLFAFGHGLSYTSFAYQTIALEPGTLGAGGAATLRVTVQNTGTRDGDEVVQVYARAKNPPVPMPIRWLVGFRRVHVKSGQTATVAINVPSKRLQRWDERAARFVVDAGTYEFEAGPSSDRPALSTTLDLH